MGHLVRTWAKMQNWHDNNNQLTVVRKLQQLHKMDGSLILDTKQTQLLDKFEDILNTTSSRWEKHEVPWDLKINFY